MELQTFVYSTSESEFPPNRNNKFLTISYILRLTSNSSFEAVLIADSIPTERQRNYIFQVIGKKILMCIRWTIMTAEKFLFSDRCSRPMIGARLSPVGFADSISFTAVASQLVPRTNSCRKLRRVYRFPQFGSIPPSSLHLSPMYLPLKPDSKWPFKWPLAKLSSR